MPRLVMWLPLTLLLTVAPALGQQVETPDTPEPRASIDATTLRHKVVCGYQGWFRCPGDPAGRGWLHWSRNGGRISPRTLTFEMWPDMAEYGQGQKYAAPGFTHPDGGQAYLFSSADRETVELHFEWMRRYGIDGVMAQRFLVNLRDPSFDLVLDHVRASAEKTGRVYAVGYDMSGARTSRLHDLLVEDWKRLVDERSITRDERYLHHDGKPVLMIWGFFSDRFDADVADRIIDFFRAEGPYQATLIGGCQWSWRQETDERWAKAFRRFDVISPWNVGHYTRIDGQRLAATDYWREDLEQAERSGMEYLPVIYPGFGWTNLKGPEAARATAPRLGGEFYWRQFVDASRLGIDMAYVAMFDEVDEATAIFKVSDSPPTQARFTDNEGLPTDWYLRLTGEASRLMRGEGKAELSLPISR